MYSDHPNEWGQPPQDPYYYYNPATGAPLGGTPYGGGPGYDPHYRQSAGGGGNFGQGQGNYGQQQQGQGGAGGAYFNPMNNPAFNPVLQNLAKQYGESLVGQGREMVDEKLQKFVTVSKLKYYFAVDTAYVMKKLGLLLFPFTHKVSGNCKRIYYDYDYKINSSNLNYSFCLTRIGQ